MCHVVEAAMASENFFQSGVVVLPMFQAETDRTLARGKLIL